MPYDKRRLTKGLPRGQFHQTSGSSKHSSLHSANLASWTSGPHTANISPPVHGPVPAASSLKCSLVPHCPRVTILVCVLGLRRQPHSAGMSLGNVHSTVTQSLCEDKAARPWLTRFTGKQMKDVRVRFKVNICGQQ